MVRKSDDLIEDIEEKSEMKIFIDSKEITVSDSNKNIVEIAAENGIVIPAPCFKEKRKYG
ncbi:hypothetical protein ACFLYK_03355 [Candidatus Cloacimonadota bacterium]